MRLKLIAVIMGLMYMDRLKVYRNDLYNLSKNPDISFSSGLVNVWKIIKEERKSKR